ncbi:hypothetical protein ILYODFUR_039041 [Ilyodon furcidens]|uniref:Uncharacterized protein n=1 Tax=Ilyodon furcidens TaxID=33524 RepID=A0ABV0UC11_9TELE
MEETEKEKEVKSKCTKDNSERKACEMLGKEEAELRHRKAMAREMGENTDLNGKVAGRTDNASREKDKKKDKKAPPPYSNGDTSPSSPYALLQMSLQALAVSKPDLDCYPPRRHVLGAVGGPPIIDRPKEQSNTITVPSADDRRKEDPSFQGSSPEPVSSTGSHHTPISHHTPGADRRAHRKDNEGVTSHHADGGSSGTGWLYVGTLPLEPC